MKAIADGHRRDHKFHVGEWVLVKLRPYRETTASGAVQSKLAKRFYGPFQITEKMRPVAYKLALPEKHKSPPSVPLFKFKTLCRFTHLRRNGRASPVGRG